MVAQGSKNLKYLVLVLILLCALEVESKQGGSRRKNTGGRRTTPRSHNTTPKSHHTTPRQHHTTPRSKGHHDIGFENMQHRVPQQNSPPISFNTNQHAGGGHKPQQGDTFQKPNHPQQEYHPQAGAPKSYMPHSASGYPGNYYQSPGGGVYNPQPYYNPHYNGAPPQIYQPVQQSSGIGGSLLGYAGTFAGGYLIGKLTSGGSNSGDRKYEVHHYHHNRDGVPKQITVTNNRLATCSQNDTQDLCVPNTFPICLSNRTIMCVTHTPYTVPCGTNATMACVISILPCPDGNSTCNSTGNLTETAVYIPCISNVSVVKRRRRRKMKMLDNTSSDLPSNVTSDSVLNIPSISNVTVAKRRRRNVLENTTSGLPSNVTSDSVLNNAKVELCVTAIAEPVLKSTSLPFGMNKTDGSTTNMPWNRSISSSTGSFPVTTSTPFTAYSSTGNSLFNVSSSIETTTISFLNETNLPGTVQPLSH